jgi:tellurite resistance protein TehA-like permease
MGTGIVSVALALGGQQKVSYVLLVVAAIVWIALGLVLLGRAGWDRPRFLAEARSPAGLTGVAATAVLGARVVELGWGTLGGVLLVVALLVWPILTIVVLRRIRPRLGGEWFMVTVASEGLAALAAGVAVAEHARWLADLALVLAAVGLSLYPLVVVRFDAHGLAAGRGEHWVAGGSLAIAALAFAQLATAERRLGGMPGSSGSLAKIALALWLGAMLWLVALVIAELRWPRTRYHPHRWSTVFPLGMYAVCSFNVAVANRTPWIADFARGWTWISLAVWTLTFTGMLRRGLSAPAETRYGF